MKFCIKSGCAEELEDNAKFCSKCGAAQQEKQREEKSEPVKAKNKTKVSFSKEKAKKKEPGGKLPEKSKTAKKPPVRKTASARKVVAGKPKAELKGTGFLKFISSTLSVSNQSNPLTRFNKKRDAVYQYTEMGSCNRRPCGFSNCLQFAMKAASDPDNYLLDCKKIKKSMEDDIIEELKSIDDE
jgi:hypothetical protein